MKIISQSADELVLKDGSAGGIAVGAIFAVIGVCIGIFLRNLRDAAPFMIWVALGVVVLGVCIVLFSSAITVTASRSNGQMFYEKKRIVGGSSMAYPIASVLRIETRKQWRTETSSNSGNNNSMPRQVLVAQSIIVFKDGKELALDHQKSSSSVGIGSVVLMDGQGKEVALALQVANFLGVPFQEIAPPSFGMGNIQVNL